MKYHDFEIELLDAPAPRASRRFLLSTRGTTFADLHQAIQDTTCFTDSHLYSFAFLKGPSFCASEFALSEFEDDSGERPAKAVKLKDIFGPQGMGSVIYSYDFGDDWQILVQYRGQMEERDTFFRRLIDGQGTWPPEDCGGSPGLLALLEAHQRKVDNKRLTTEQKGLLEWADGWSPGTNLDQIKKSFNCAKRPRRAGRG